ncbi:MAG: tubulin-like doman-containing protein [bacterium]
MAYYAIGIGGTGAKCIESLIHLCSAGLMPTNKEMYVLFVDPDKSNGTLERAELTLQLYSTCRELKLGSIDLFKTPISVAIPDVWSPFGQETKPNLEEFFTYDEMKSNTPNVVHLFDVLFSTEEKGTRLDEGFRGHPAIGAAVLTSTIDLGSGEPWKTFRDKIARDAKTGEPAKIILFGSIFGGTGASGLPTIARLIKEELKKNKIIENYHISAVAMLPYFSFDRTDDNEMRAQAENFLINTQAALKYYAGTDYLDAFNSLYVLGDHVLTPLGPSLTSGKDPKGGKDQRNEPHFLEIYAALAAIDFFKTEKPDNCMMIARKQTNVQSWYDIPFVNDRRYLLAKLDQLVRFAFAYDCTYYPTLQSIARNGRGYRSPWYINLFERSRDVQLSKVLDAELLKVRDYCQTFLLWAANVQASAKEVDMQLFNHNTFATSKKENGKQTIILKDPKTYFVQEFADLLLPCESEKANALDHLWERMSDSNVSDAQARASGRFINALYTQCKTEKFAQMYTVGKE